MKSSFFSFFFSFGYLNAFDSNHMTSSVAFLTCLKNNNRVFAPVRKEAQEQIRLKQQVYEKTNKQTQKTGRWMLFYCLIKENESRLI